jgi:hypothetical protein
MQEQMHNQSKAMFGAFPFVPPATTTTEKK